MCVGGGGGVSGCGCKDFLKKRILTDMAFPHRKNHNKVAKPKISFAWLKAIQGKKLVLQFLISAYTLCPE